MIDKLLITTVYVVQAIIKFFLAGIILIGTSEFLDMLDVYIRFDFAEAIVLLLISEAALAIGGIISKKVICIEC